MKPPFPPRNRNRGGGARELPEPPRLSPPSHLVFLRIPGLQRGGLGGEDAWEEGVGKMKSWQIPLNKKHLVCLRAKKKEPSNLTASSGRANYGIKTTRGRRRLPRHTPAGGRRKKGGGARLLTGECIITLSALWKHTTFYVLSDEPPHSENDTKKLTESHRGGGGGSFGDEVAVLGGWGWA